MIIIIYINNLPDVWKCLKIYVVNIEKTKKGFRKKLVKGIKIFLKKSKKKKKKKCKNLVLSKIKLSLVEYRKKYYKKRKNRPASQI